MTSDEAVRRLRAFQKGRPLPSGETLRVPRVSPAQQLVLAFVKMGGESSPWGLAYGRPDKTPTILSVSEARTRDDVAEMMSRFAPVLLTHLHQPQHSPFGPDPDAKVPTFQVWLPNDSHLEMLHHLAYAYTFNRAEDLTRRKKLRALGHACGWLFREAQRPGQMVVMVASRVLREAYTFPSETTRQGHLGFLLAWLRTGGGREARMDAADEAERLSVSTSLDPVDEREELQPYLEMFNEGRKDRNSVKTDRGRRNIEKFLHAELKRRFDLVVETVRAFEADKRLENRYLHKLVEESLKEHTLQYRRIEAKQDDAQDGPAFIPSPETDRYPSAAGSRYYVQQASEELRDLLLVHDDREMQAQLVASGQAIAGTIVDVWDEGEGRKTVPIWVVETDTDTPLRLREDTELCVVGLRERRLRILEIESREPAGRRFKLQVTGLVTVPRGNDGSVLPATSGRLKRRKVVLVKTSMDQIARRKSGLIWNRDLPGAWLTHAVPKNAAELPAEVSEDLKEIEAKR
jgi:hypothetical protein